MLADNKKCTPNISAYILLDLYKLRVVMKLRTNVINNEIIATLQQCYYALAHTLILYCAAFYFYWFNLLYVLCTVSTVFTCCKYVSNK